MPGPDGSASARGEHATLVGLRIAPWSSRKQGCSISLSAGMVVAASVAKTKHLQVQVPGSGGKHHIGVPAAEVR